MKHKCIIVNRVSSVEQKDGYSLDAQSRKGNEYASEKNFEIIKEYTFQESASKSKESKLFDDIMAFIYAFTGQSKQPLHVVVEKKDRWGRLHARKELIQSLVLAKKVVLHYYRENQILDHTCSPEDIFMDDVVTSMNKYVGLNIGREAKKGMIEKAKQGWFPHKPPAGYMNNPDKKSSSPIIVKEEEKKFIERLFELRGEHLLSYSSIADALKKEGLVPPRLIRTFRKSYVEKLLKNPFYRGSFEFAGQVYPGKHERIIPQALIDAVDQAFRKSGRNVTKHNGLFSNMLTCGECGCKISFHKKIKNGKEYRLYVCANGKKQHSSLKGAYTKEHEILDGLGTALDDITISNDFAADIANALNKNDLKIKAKIRNEKEAYERAIANFERDEDELYKDLKGGFIDAQMFDRNVQRIRTEKQKVANLLFEAQNQANETYSHTAREILELAQNAKQLWLERSDQEKVEFLNKILWNPKITGTTIEYHLRKPFSVLTKMKQTESWGEYLDEFGTACRGLAA